MRSITKRMAICFLSSAMLAGSQVRDPLAGEPVIPHTSVEVLAGGMSTWALADEPPAQSISSPDCGGEAGTAAGEGAPTSRTPAPPKHEEAVLPESGTDIHERGILPGLVRPGPVLQSPAPTPSLTAIRNALKVTSKSISVNLRIPPNLAVTVPVEVSVAYISPVQTRRQTKTYNPATGLTILYREAEGDGKPRPMHLDITVRELVPNGKSFSFSKDFTITPLYDISITNLRFTMLSFCDRLGKNDITFVWSSPDGRRREIKFDAGAHEEKVISQFSWGHRGVSMQTDLQAPVVQFFERDPVPDFGFNPIRSGIPLLPGPAKQFHAFILNEKASGPPGQAIFSSNCQAEIKYRITRALMPFDQF